MTDRTWVAGVALALMGCLLLPFVWDIAVFRVLVSGFVVVGLAGAGVSLVAWVLGRRGRYDLEALRKVHERAEVQRLLEDEPEADGDTILCRCCGSVYSATLGVCPECGHVAGR